MKKVKKTDHLSISFWGGEKEPAREMEVGYEIERQAGDCGTWISIREKLFFGRDRPRIS